MWALDPKTNTTSTYVLPTSGIISVNKPEGIEVFPYVNDVAIPVHHIHGKAGDAVYFKLSNTNYVPTPVTFEYEGTNYSVDVPASVIKQSTESGTILEEQIMTPAETINLFSNPGMGGGGAGAIGGGLGAGLVGGMLGGALLGNRGILGGGGVDNVGGVVTPALLASSLAQVTDTQNNTTVMQSLGDIKASVPLAEGQVQLALAGASANIMSQANTNQMATMTGQAGTNKAISEAIAASLASQNNINTNVLQSAASVKESIAAFGVANLTATSTAAANTLAAINGSTKEILAALNAQDMANLQRQLTVAETALLEQRSVGLARSTEVNVSQVVNQSQAQAQAQQQFLTTNNLLQALLTQSQIATATNQQLIIGNSGVTAAGPQTANPVNVRA